MKPLLCAVDAVLFDLDGTLVETNIDFALMRREVTALAAEAGVDVDELRGLDILATLARAVETLITGGRPTDAERIRLRGMATLQEIELRHAADTREIAFARELLDDLRNRGIRTGIVTRNCRAASELSLSITGVQADIVICREDSNNHKPHPEPILLALSKLGAEPRNSIMVGDHIMDVQAGKAAGMKTIGFLRDDRPRDFFASAAPDVVAHNLREVLDAIVGRDS